MFLSFILQVVLAGREGKLTFTEALFSGKELLLADDRARILGYKDGNVKVRVKQVDHATGRVCVGVDDGMQEAWVFKDELRPVEAGRACESISSCKCEVGLGGRAGDAN